MSEDKNLPMRGLEKGRPEQENKNIENGEMPASKAEKLRTPEIEIKREGAVSAPRIEKESGKKTEQTGEGDASGAGQISGKLKERQKKIEKILEEDLKDIYLGLPPNKQNEFKIAGEQTAAKINELLEKGKVKLGQIIDLIKKWLQMIPGVNKFFLEQEAKIKSDAIINMEQNDKLG